MVTPPPSLCPSLWAVNVIAGNQLPLMHWSSLDFIRDSVSSVNRISP
uniref:Uncharacterized protein n=1 Tax=Anguilla anguilla TaxID=7936 RepID=A0A0E9SXK4_ANGAN